MRRIGGELTGGAAATVQQCQAWVAQLGAGLYRAGVRYCKKGVLVKQVQDRLLELGYEIDADGFFRPQSARGIAQFQQAQVLSISAFIDPRPSPPCWAEDRKPWQTNGKRTDAESSSASRSCCLSQLDGIVSGTWPSNQGRAASRFARVAIAQLAAL